MARTDVVVNQRADHAGTVDRPRTIRAVFREPRVAYDAIDRLRAAGFPIEVEGSLAGDTVVRVQASPDRLTELDGLVEDHDGRVETQQQTG